MDVADAPLLLSSLPMHPISLILCLLLATGLTAAQTPEDRFFAAADLARQAELAITKGEWQRAHDLYTTAIAELKKIRTEFPTWNEQVVDFRIRTFTHQLADLKPVLATAGPSPEELRVRQLTDELAAAQTQIAELETVRTQLTAKLTELESQTADLRQQLADLRAIRDEAARLTSANENLTAQLAALRDQLATLQTQAQLKQQLATEAITREKTTAEKLAAVIAERDALRDTNTQLTAELNTARQQLADQLQQLTDRLDAANQELSTLRRQAARAADHRAALLDAASAP
jgi:chromosome segregation ATPase